MLPVLSTCALLIYGLVWVLLLFAGFFDFRLFFVYRRTYDRKLAHHLRQVLFVLHINRWATKSDTSVANPPVPYFRNCVTKNRIIGESKMWNRKQKESLNMRTLCQIFVITEYQPVFLETQTFAVMVFVNKINI